MAEVLELTSEAMLEEALRTEGCLLFKHSRICPISGWALGEVERFQEEHPDFPVYMIDVRAQRPLSLAVAERLGIRHESPQALLLREGRVRWHGSHRGITARTLLDEAE